jgi:LytS/YehU family sensor histidine kinase
LENLVSINRSRFDYPLEITFIQTGAEPHHMIIPLVLMTLAENVFKHGDLCGKPAVIRLSVSAAGELEFYTGNHKRPLPPVKRIRRIGIENIRTRLNFSYGDRYELTIHETDDYYESRLTLNL